MCCDMDQSDSISKIELIPFSVLSTDNTNYKNDILYTLQEHQRNRTFAIYQ